MPGRPIIKVEDKPKRDLRKLARALLMLAEQQLRDDQTVMPPTEEKQL